jgi:spore maturation protein SpmA
MALNYIWIGFFVIAFLVALIKLIFFGDTGIFNNVVNGMFDSAKTGAEISIGLIGVMTFWLGIMKIGERAGMISLFAKGVSPFFSRLFPGVPKSHPANGSIIMNFSANMLGLDNAATPVGLKAMQELQELNPEKDTATNAQIMFLVLNTA